MYRFYIIIKKYYPIFFLFLFILLMVRNLNPYQGNSWGNYYFVEKKSPVYYAYENEVSIYTLEIGDVIMCDSKYEDESIYSKNNRLFCWYSFDKNKEPISGWIDIEYIRMINE